MAGVIPTIPRFQFSDTAGVPLAGGTVDIYLAGTTTRANTWQDRSQTTLNTNPVTLDAAGSFIAWLDSTQSYKFVVKNALGVVQSHLGADNISGAGSVYELGLASGATLVGYGSSTVGDALDAANLTGYTALRAYAGTSKSAYVTGYLASAAPSGIAGLFTRDDSDTTSADNGGTIIVASNGKRWKRAFSGDLRLEWFGAVCDGVTDDTAAVQSAKGALGGTVTTLAYKGTPLVKATIDFSSQVTITAARAAHFVKHSSVSGPCLLLSGNGITMNGGGVVCQVGNTGDGIQVTGRGVAVRDVYATGAGGHGIRVGHDSNTKNANLFVLDNCNCAFNGGDGIYIHDNPGGASNANGGTIINPDVAHNTGNGLRFGNAYFNTVTGGAYQSNSQYGLYFDSASNENSRFGGDSEMNTVGDVFIAATAYKTRMFGQRYSETVTDMTAANTFNGRHERRAQNYQTHIFQDNPRNWPVVVTGTGVGAKTVSAITTSGTTATATITAHGYNAGDTFFMYPNISGQNPADAPFGGPWSVASVVDANTITFTLPTTGYPAAAAETYASFVGYPLGGAATGDWRIEDGWVTFESFVRLNTGTLNAAITGNVTVYGPPMLNTKGNALVRLDLYFCANLNGYTLSSYVGASSLKITINKAPAAAAAGAVVSVPVTDLVINSNTYLVVSGRYRAA